ncbi:hypothetical protein MPTK2_3g22990 [Marchantia polymorpha subsp. ruderalis]
MWTRRVYCLLPSTHSAVALLRSGTERLYDHEVGCCLSVCLPACGRTEAGDGRSAAANVNSHLSSDGHCYPLQSHCKSSCALMTSSSLPQFYSNPGSGRSLTSCLPELVTRRENLCSVVRSL